MTLIIKKKKCQFTKLCDKVALLYFVVLMFWVFFPSF
jgi:hypothetical protein